MDILILDREFKTVDVLDMVESLIWTDRFREYGEFEIYTTTEIKLLQNLQENYYLWRDDSEHVMIIETRTIDSSTEEGTKLIVSGRSLESILDRRIVWKQTILNGNLQTEIQRLLNENLISPSDSKRKISNFIFESSTDPDITSLKIELQTTGDTLYDVVNAVCQVYNIGFKVTLNAKNQFVFKLYKGQNRSYDQTSNPYVVFSPSFENIINSNYIHSVKLLKNVTLVAGEGEGTARKVLEVSANNESYSGLDRRELFTDARDISSDTSEGTLTTAEYNALLKKRGEESLSENVKIEAFDGQVETTILYKYNEDFFMGDICQLENEYGMEAKVQVLEYITSEDLNGMLSYPGFTVVA